MSVLYCEGFFETKTGWFGKIKKVNVYHDIRIVRFSFFGSRSWNSYDINAKCIRCGVNLPERMGVDECDLPRELMSLVEAIKKKPYSSLYTALYEDEIAAILYPPKKIDVIKEQLSVT